MRQAVRQSMGVIIWIVLIFVCYPVIAQATEPLVRVPALRYLDPSGYVYTVGEPFKVNVDHSSLGGEVDLGKLRARLFRGTFDNVTREAKRRLVGNCTSIFSTVLRPNESDGGIDFGLNFDEHWLHPNGASGLLEEHYILVFELDGPEGRWLDLEKDSIDQYFERGFFFTVQPDHSVKPEEARRIVSEMRVQGRQVRADLLKRQEVASERAAATTATTESAPETVHCWKLRLIGNQVSRLSSFDPVECAIEKNGKMRWSWLSRFLKGSRQHEDSALSSTEGALGE